VLKVLLSGSTGLVGRSLTKVLHDSGHQVVPLTRGRREQGRAWWDPESGEIDLAPAGQFDAAIHLAGENVASGKWTTGKKAKIRASRVQGSALLAEALAAMPTPPGSYLQASAIGFYGDRGEDILDESSGPGAGFLSETCAAWEKASGAAEAAGIRTVKMRIGVVMDRSGGALKKMLTPFRLGLGGPVGNGRQYVSWISLRDVCAAVLHLLENDSISGAVNLVSPGAVPQRELARALGQALHRPAMVPLPAAIVRLAFGEMGNDLLLASTRVRPARLEESGFRFEDPEIRKLFQSRFVLQ
jgi:uncharacterized protein (TIGR01777 family)